MRIEIKKNPDNGAIYLVVFERDKAVPERDNILYMTHANVPENSSEEKVVADLLRICSYRLLDGSVTLDGLN